MSQIDSKLSQLRGLFIIFFAAQLIVDIVLGWDYARVGLGIWRGSGLGRLNLSRGALLALVLIVSGLLFALGLWLFRNLRQRKNWARLALLVIGWLAVADALLSFLFTSRGLGFMPWLRSLEPGLYWHRVILIDRVKDFLGLVFWGYLIYVLQIHPEVKRAFWEPAQGSGTGTDR